MQSDVSEFNAFLNKRTSTISQMKESARNDNNVRELILIMDKLHLSLDGLDFVEEAQKIIDQEKNKFQKTLSQINTIEAT
jgi:hypothetical protein